MTIKIVLVETIDELLIHRDAWQDLAENALESNIFHEPCALLAALTHFGPKDMFLALLVYENDRLIGFFPHKVRSKFVGRYLLELYRHRHSFLQTPLVHNTMSREAIDAWLDWCRSSIGTAVVICTGIRAGGPVATLIEECVGMRGGYCSYRNDYSRPFIKLTGEGEARSRQSLSGKRRRDLARLRRRLESKGKFEFRKLEPKDEIGPWIEDFINLEASGWKGENQSAIGSDPKSAAFFRTMIESLHERAQIRMFGLALDDHWIAMNCILKTAGSSAGGFGFKSAYDENFKEFSPSNILLIDIINLLNENPHDVSWIDSCARAENPFLEKLCSDKRDIRTVTIGLPGLRGRLGLAALELGLKTRTALRGDGVDEQSGGLKAGRT